MASYTAAELLTIKTAQEAADAARMAGRPKGQPRYAWAVQHPLPADMPRIEALVDTSFKTQPTRVMSLHGYGRYLEARVHGGRRVDVIRLSEPDADARLARYERAR